MATSWAKEIVTDSGTTTSTVSSTSSWTKELLDVSASVGRIEVDDLILDGSSIGLATDTDLLELSNSIVQLNGNLLATSTIVALGNLQCASTLQSTNGEFTGDVSIAGTLTLGGSAITSNAGELNLLDGSQAGVVVNSKAVVYNGSGNVQATTVTTTGNATIGGTIAGTLSTAAQGNITSLGTLTTLTVDNVIINGTTIGHTSDADLLTLADGALTIAGNTVISGDLTINGGNITNAITFDDDVTFSGSVTGYTVNSITGAHADTLSQPADDIWRFSSNDEILALQINSGGSNKDTQLTFLEAGTAKWYIANDATGGATDDLFTVGTGSTIASNQKFTLDTSGNAVISGYLIVGSQISTGAYLDLTGTTDASDASGDTGVLRCEGGASIAKKLYVGTALSVGTTLTVGTDLDVDGVTNLDNVDIDGTFNYKDKIINSGNNLLFKDNTSAIFGDDSDASINFISSTNIFKIHSTASNGIFVGGPSNLQLGDTSGYNIFIGHTTSTTTIQSDNFKLTSDEIQSSGGNQAITIASDASKVHITNDLSVDGSKIYFGNAESISNEVDELFLFTASSTDDRMLLAAQSGGAGEDSGILLYEGPTIRWSMQQDASDDTDQSLVWDYGTVTAGAATKMNLDSSGNLELAGTIQTGTTRDWTITNLTENRSLNCDAVLTNAQILDIVGTIVTDIQEMGLMR